MRTLVITLVVMLAASVVMCHRQQGREVVVRDTVTITQIDTIRHTQIQYRDRYVTRTDTVLLMQTDSVEVEVLVPISTYQFEDSTYKAQVSGYDVSLDYMEVYQRTIYRDVETIIKPKPKRWGLGVQAGYGFTHTGQASVYLGLGISYNLFTF